jgi:hypothetical protein
VNPATVARGLADTTVLDTAAEIAEEALACHREALVLLAEGWQSETGSAITAFLDLQCAHAADIVDVLRGASRGIDPLPGTWADTAGDPSSGPMPGAADPLPWLPGVGSDGADPITPAPAPMPLPMPTAAPAPAPVPGQFPSPWTAPVAADAPWTASAPAGLAAPPSPPAFPDLGGALVGLVAEIAQALGSYVDATPAPQAGTAIPPEAGGKGTDGSPPTGRHPAHHPATTLTDSNSAGSTSAGSTSTGSGPTLPTSAPTPTGPLNTAPAAGPTSTAPPPPTPAAAPTASPPPAPPAPQQELLAAERPPEPSPVPNTAAGSPVPAPAPEAGPSPDAAAPQAQRQPDAGKTPCEIAADELPKVGA